MRLATISRSSAVCALLAGLAGLAFAAEPAPKPLFDTSGFRPVVVLAETPVTSSKPVVSLTGVVFSRAALESVSVGPRTAALRPAEPRDLAAWRTLPEGAADAPTRTVFELRDVPLPRFGANDLELRVVDNDGRAADVHRITILRVLEPESGTRR